MPRLEGKRSNTGLMLVLVLVVLLLVVLGLEYAGTINLISNFGAV